MNYEKIAEGLSRALKEISEAVDACVKDCVVYRTQAMQHNIANLYAHIFFFLRNTIDWYMKKSIKRALSSLREDFYEKFEEEVSNIKRISQAISREAQHGSHSEIRYTRMLTEDTVIGLQDLKRDLAERKYREERAAKESAREREAMLVLQLEKMKRLDDLHRLIGESAKTLLLERASAFIFEGAKGRGTQSSNALNSRIVPGTTCANEYHRVEESKDRTGAGRLQFPFLERRYQLNLSSLSQWKEDS